MALTGRAPQDLADYPGHGNQPPGAPPPPLNPWVSNVGIGNFIYVIDCNDLIGEIEFNFDNGLGQLGPPQIGGLATVIPCNTSWSIRFSIATQTIGGGWCSNCPPHPWTANYSATSTQGAATTLPVWLGPSVGAGNEYTISTTGPITSAAEQAVRFVNLYGNTFYEVTILDCECDGVIGTPPTAAWGQLIWGNKTLEVCCNEVGSHAMHPWFGVMTIPYSYAQNWMHDQLNWTLAAGLGTMDYTGGSAYGPYTNVITNPWPPWNVVSTPYLTNIPTGATMENNLTAFQFNEAFTFCEWAQDWRVNGSIPGTFDARTLQWQYPINSTMAEEMCDCCAFRSDPPPGHPPIPPRANWVQ